jgi:hypothetical protein
MFIVVVMVKKVSNLDDVDQIESEIYSSKKIET